MYQYMYGVENVICAEGNSNLWGIVSSVSEDEECTVIVDVVYNNVKTLKYFYLALSTCVRNKRKNVHFIPIICSEYTFAMLMDISGLVSNTDFADIINMRKPYACLSGIQGVSEKNFKNIEKVFKLLLGKVSSNSTYLYSMLKTCPEKYLSDTANVLKYVMSSPIVDMLSNLSVSTSYEATMYIFEFSEKLAELNKDEIPVAYYTYKNGIIGLLQNFKEPME